MQLTVAEFSEAGYHESRKTRRKQLAENNWSKILGGKLVEKQLAEKSPAANSSQEQKIISGKYSANFVIIPCYEVLNDYEVLHCKL